MITKVNGLRDLVAPYLLAGRLPQTKEPATHRGGANLGDFLSSSQAKPSEVEPQSGRLGAAAEEAAGRPCRWAGCTWCRRCCVCGALVNRASARSRWNGKLLSLFLAWGCIDLWRCAEIPPSRKAEALSLFCACASWAAADMDPPSGSWPATQVSSTSPEPDGGRRRSVTDT